jgi:hypothetical protein
MHRAYIQCNGHILQFCFVFINFVTFSLLKPCTSVLNLQILNYYCVRLLFFIVNYRLTCESAPVAYLKNKYLILSFKTNRYTVSLLLIMLMETHSADCKVVAAVSSARAWIPSRV